MVWDDGEADESKSEGAAEPFGRIEPDGRRLTRQAKHRKDDRAALERLAAEIYRPLQEYARTWRWVTWERDE